VTAKKKAATTGKPSKAGQSGKDNPKVSNDPLADLGLDDTTTTATETAPVTATETTPPVTEGETETSGTREEVEIGDIEFGFVTDLPTAKRKTEGSKYKFDKLPAPKKDGDVTQYANFTVKLQPGVDADKLRRSVQSATTQANKANKDKYFVSRTVSKDGEFVGMMVIRTDQRPK
jgi:hypothetical protein